MAETSNNTKSSTLYRRLLGYALAYRGYFLVSFLGFLLFGFMEAAMIQMVEYFIEGLENRDAKYIIYIPIAIIVLRFFHGLGSYLGNYFIARVGVNVVADLRKQLFKSFMYLPSEYYDRHNSGEVVSLLIYNIQQVTGSVTNAIKTVMREGLTVIGLLALMFYHDWLLTLCFLVIAPVLGWLVSIASRSFRRISRRMQVTMGGITHIANESLQGIRLVRSFLGQRYEIDRFNATTNENTRLSAKYERVSALQGPVFHLVIAIALALVLLVILIMWEGETGAAIAYLTAAAAITKPLRSLSSVNEIIQRGLAAAETIFDVIDSPGEPDTGTQRLEVKQGKIEFNNVRFEYADGTPAIKNLNLTVEPGQTVALVGKSGSGKTTLANLLLRLYETTDGAILIDDQNIREVTLDSLRGQVSLVNQQTTLFNDTITRNIAYGAKPEDIRPADVEQAAVHANAIDFIKALPQGFETTVGESGDRLSGGQRQRIAVARALYKDAPILILDEATSALDNESEKAIQGALEHLQQGRTTLIIAHRLSTIEGADKIVVLDQGEIVESGTHGELLVAQGYYANLYHSQFSENE